MKFVKGMVIGSIVSAGIIMLCNENMNVNKKRIIRKGKQYDKKNWNNIKSHSFEKVVSIRKKLIDTTFSL